MTKRSAEVQDSGRSVQPSEWEELQDWKNWPTPRANENDQGTADKINEAGSSWKGQNRGATLTTQVKAEEKNWATPQVTDIRTDVRKPEERSNRANRGGCKNLREEVHRAENWPTPDSSPRGTRADDLICEGGNQVERRDSGQKRGIDLQTKVKAEEKNWGTPRVTNNGGSPSPQCTGKGSRLEDQVADKNWTTPQARDFRSGEGKRFDNPKRTQNLNDQIDKEENQNWPSPNCRDTRRGCNQKQLATSVDKEENWATPNTMDHLPSRSYEAMKRQAKSGGRKNRSKPGNLREQMDPEMQKAYDDAKKEQNWPTPRSGTPGSRKPGTGGKVLSEEVKKNENWRTPTVAETHNQDFSTQEYLQNQVKKNENWGTPQASDHIEGSRTDPNSNQKCLGRDVNRLQEDWTTPCADDTGDRKEKYAQGGSALSYQAKGKLNPRWVETLMGLPIGWTMPSCTELNNPEIYTACDNRVDELRLLGNGVVPQTVAKAFYTLLQRLTNNTV